MPIQMSSKKVAPDDVESGYKEYEITVVVAPLTHIFELRAASTYHRWCVDTRYTQNFSLLMQRMDVRALGGRPREITRSQAQATHRAEGGEGDRRRRGGCQGLPATQDQALAQGGVKDSRSAGRRGSPSKPRLLSALNRRRRDRSGGCQGARSADKPASFHRLLLPTSVAILHVQYSLFHTSVTP